MPSHTVFLPMMVLSVVLGWPTYGAAQIHKIGSKIAPGSYKLLKMEFDGKTLQPNESMWTTLYWPEKAVLWIDVRLFPAPDKAAPKEARLWVQQHSKSKDDRAFQASMFLYNENSEVFSNNHIAGLINYDDDLITVCFKCASDGTPLVVGQTEAEVEKGNGKLYPELPHRISAKKGEGQIVYYYKRIKR